MVVRCGARPATFASALLALLAFVSLLSPSAPSLADEKRPRIALVLGGGGARGVAHIGVLKVLEEMRIPIDCIAGTSMGALVGGGYAAGVPIDEMTRELAHIDWDDIFTDDPPRTEKPFRAKRDDYENLFKFELGQRGTNLLLPSGTTAGYKFEFLLRRLVQRAGNFADEDFDRLPIPYRALATNIEDGTSKEFSRGDLVKVMRASMSVPGVIAPAEIAGELYVDGGLLQNLPVAVARQTCGDVVIAVNVGSGLLPRAELSSALGISLQMIRVLTEQNVRKSMAELSSSDVLIQPDLDDYSAVNFADALSLIPIGEAAARRHARELSRLSLSEADYKAWRDSVAARLPVVPPVTDVRVATALGRVNPEVIQRQLAEVPGIDLRRRPETDFSIENLNKRLEQVYGDGDFERMDYRMLDYDGERTVKVEGVEKSWGPDYLKFGFGFASDTYDTRVDANLSHRMTWLNSLGAEWRNDLKLGYRQRLASEFFQPFSFRTGAFVAPRIELGQEPVVFYVNDRRIGQYRVQYARAHLDVGLQNKYGELRIGPYTGRLRATEDFDTFLMAANFDERQTGYTASAVFDQIDSPNFGRNGALVSLNTFSALGKWGSDRDYAKTELSILGAKSVGNHAVQLAGYIGKTVRGDLPAYDPFLLGGFLRGSGYRIDELLGTRVGFARAVYTYKFAALPPQLGRGLYLGGSLEATRATIGFDPAADAKIRRSASIFIGADTILGPAYFAFGQGLNEERPRAFYIILGKP
jgi:NTE family protein